MRQFVIAYQYNHSMSEVSRRIADTLSANPHYSVQTMSTAVYDSPTGGKYIDAIVVYNIDRDRATLDTPKLAGDVWDNGYRLPFSDDPVPCAKNKE